MNLQSAISDKYNEPTTNSIKVSEAFKKNHRDITRKIENLSCSQDFRSAHFCAYPYKHPQNGETYKAYAMTKDGFMFLVMGFTGEKAAKIKEAYINAFNAMAEELDKKHSSLQHTFDQEELGQTGKTFKFRGMEAHPIEGNDGRIWMSALRLGELLSYWRTDAVKLLLGLNIEKFQPHHYGFLTFNKGTRREKKALIISSEAWPLVASLSRCDHIPEFIKTVNEYCSDEVTISREEWEQIKHHASKGEEQYREIAKASNDLIKTVGEAQMTFGINKIITQKH